MVGPFKWRQIPLDSFDIYKVSAVCLNPDGVLAVQNNDPKQLILFATTGELIGRFGRSGQGPQEFAYVPEIFWDPHRQAFGLLDETQNRVSFWSAEGQFREMLILPRFQWTQSIHGLGDGSVVFISDVFGYAQKPPQIHRVIGPEHQVLRHFTMDQPFSGTARTEMGPFGMVNDFHPRLLMDVGANLMVVCNSQDPTVYVLNQDGTAIGQVTATLQAYEVTDTYLRAWLRTHEPFVQQMVQLANIEKTKVFPMIHKLLVDDAQRIWIFGQQGPLTGRYETQVYQDFNLVWAGFVDHLPFQIAGQNQLLLLETDAGLMIQSQPIPF